MILTEKEKLIYQKPVPTSFDAVLKIRKRDLKRIKDLLGDIPHQSPEDNFKLIEYKESKI
jgi:hypothetical protein